MLPPSATEVLLCTGNPGKVAELRALLPPGLVVRGLTELGLPLDLPENGTTLEANALEKARFGHRHSGLPAIADDTGLEVAALGGAPGVYSARYAGEARDAAANIAKLLHALQGVADRAARFRTVIAWVDDAGERTFEGIVEGVITEAPHGTGGFGYDPVFRPLFADLTFAEMDARLKNAVSHRAQALWKLARSLAERDRP